MTPRSKRVRRWTGKANAYWLRGAKRWLTDLEKLGRGCGLPVLVKSLKGESVDREGWVRVRVTIQPIVPPRPAEPTAEQVEGLAKWLAEIYWGNKLYVARMWDVSKKPWMDLALAVWRAGGRVPT